MELTEELRAKIFQEVRNVNDGAQNLTIEHCHENFLAGNLFIVRFDWMEKRPENYVFVRDSKIRVAKNATLLIELANQEAKVGPIRGALAELLSIANLIALAMTGLIGYLVYMGEKEIPAILSTALTTIIGFYFGRSGKKK